MKHAVNLESQTLSTMANWIVSNDSNLESALSNTNKHLRLSSYYLSQHMKYMYIYLLADLATKKQTAPIKLW